jgi:hypothetical protein
VREAGFLCSKSHYNLLFPAIFVANTGSNFCLAFTQDYCGSPSICCAGVCSSQIKAALDCIGPVNSCTAPSCGGGDDERSDDDKGGIACFSEWVPDDAPVVQSTESDQDNPPSGEAVEASQPPAPLINSSLVSCAMGSDDCKSSAGEGEIADCAICLSHFKPQQLVCESNNSSCQHVFHKDCMVDWLMKKHNDCPLCREVYLIKAV